MKQEKAERTTNCKLHCGVHGMSFAEFSFHNSVSFGQNRFSKSAPTTMYQPLWRRIWIAYYNKQII